MPYEPQVTKIVGEAQTRASEREITVTGGFLHQNSTGNAT